VSERRDYKGTILRWEEVSSRHRARFSTNLGAASRSLGYHRRWVLRNAMKDKIVLITGANGGLGSSITTSFLSTSAMVAGASKVISTKDFPQPNFVPVPCDLTSAEGADGAVQAVISRFGKLDVLVHTVGGFAGGHTIADTDDATWNQMRDRNLSSAFYLLRAAIPHLRKSGNGRIIAIGSLAAAQPQAGLAAYVTFKSALATLIQSVALENKDAGLTANVVLPGTMDTPANRKSMPKADFSKWLQPKDVAELVLWLADERSRHITGAAIPIE
jgi:NAD(P)-dependent dehydrogenase (short-subunit alcohol dehydrogenase family)